MNKCICCNKLKETQSGWCFDCAEAYIIIDIGMGDQQKNIKNIIKFLIVKEWEKKRAAVNQDAAPTD